MLFNSSLLEGDKEVGDGDAEVTAVEGDKDEEESRSGTHSSQQQQQQSTKACPREWHRNSINKGVAAHRKNSRNCPISPRAGRDNVRSSALT